ncbi:MAG: hypothetical protein IPL61_14265 [Myxococcales bacterium]|nr:hypothetical protein [Myxococcales bacterium]
MSALDSTQEELFLGIAYALFMNRLHVLRLTEVVRLGVRPNAEDGNMDVPDPLDAELKQQAVEYVIKCFPASFTKKLRGAADHWLSLS